LDSYCKYILTEYYPDGSILEICTRPGMPSIVQVKKWFFNREFANEYAGFREEFLRLQNIKLYLYYEDLQDKLNNLKHHYIKDKKGLTIIDPKVAKEYRDFFQAIRWYERSLDLLVKLYDHHARGLDFPIEGIHFDTILQQPKELELKGPEINIERLMSALNDLGSLNIDTRTRISSSITRSEAEALLGTPLLYGRIHKKNRRKPTPRENRRGVLHTPTSANEPLRQPTPNSNPNSNFKPYSGPIPPGLRGTKYERLWHPGIPLTEYQFFSPTPFKIPSILDSS
jgi:hypothetical protein